MINIINNNNTNNSMTCGLTFLYEQREKKTERTSSRWPFFGLSTWIVALMRPVSHMVPLLTISV